MTHLSLSLALGAQQTPTETVPTGPLEFGYETGDGSGTSDAAVLKNNHNASNWVNNTGSDVSVEEIDLIQVVTGNADLVIAAALYADDAGEPGALLGVTNELTSIGTGTTTFTLSSPVTVADGATVWAAFRSTQQLLSSGANFNGNPMRRKGLSGSTAFTDPFGTNDTFARVIPTRLRGPSV